MPEPSYEQAIKYCLESLRLFRPETRPRQYAKTQANLGNIYYLMLTGNRQTNLEQATRCYEEALKFLTPETSPKDYASLQNAMGDVCAELLSGDRVSNLERSIAYFHEALRFLDPNEDAYTYAMVQNKFHFAITGKTAAEIVYTAADHHKDHMGLTTWKNSPDGRVLKSDVIIAKNFLPEKEIRQLERTVTGYFDYIEGQIERENTFAMNQLAESVNKFLTFNDYKVLEGKGKISQIQAQKKAITEYDTFNKTQKIISDFDKEIKKLDKH